MERLPRFLHPRFDVLISGPAAGTGDGDVMYILLNGTGRQCGELGTSSYSFDESTAKGLVVRDGGGGPALRLLLL